MRSVEPAVTATTAELVAGIAALAAELAVRPAPESGAASHEQAEVLGRTVDVIESAIAARVGVAARSGYVAEWGHTSPTAWLRTALGMRHARAAERATLASQLPRLPHVTKRLTSGQLSAGYAAAIAGGVRRLDDGDCAKAEDLLLGFVDQGHSVGQITRFADKIKDLIADRDDTHVEPEDGRRAERQWWTLHRSGTGSFVKGHFGPELTALLKSKLDPLARPTGPEDTRDHAERLADALQAHLSGGNSLWDPMLVIELKQPTPNPHRTRRHTPAPMPTPTGDGSRRRREPTATAGDETGSMTPGVPEPGRPPYASPCIDRHTEAAATNLAVPQAPQPSPTWPFDGTPYTARLADGTPIDPEQARAILLNAGFSTLILGTDGHPLYLGRRVRFATPAQRRVLQTRYPTCVVDGCEIPATACQVDHVDSWHHGQSTDIDQLVMCCSWHNRYKWRHPDRITIKRHTDGRYRYTINRPTEPESLGARSADRGPPTPGGFHHPRPDTPLDAQS